MKFRTTHNSIRLRLRKSELITLSKNKSVEESVNFPSKARFTHALIIDEDIEDVSAIINNGMLIVSISKSIADGWINTNQVGIERHIPLEGKEQLHILIEKDFPCLDRPEEDKNDTFWELSEDKNDQC